MPQHRALRHHASGILDCIEKFGPAITLANGKIIPTRCVGEQHVIEDMGRIPTFNDWIVGIVEGGLSELRVPKPLPWMFSRSCPLSRTLFAVPESETPAPASEGVV